ncbi:MAG: RpiB/LacA/LacB family sugar-phosphate isomerase [Patescibacteria group bacterium]
MNKEIQKVILAADHAGFKLKEAVKSFLQEKGYKVEDVGAFEYKECDDYPEYMIKAAQRIATDASGESKAVLFGGSGQGEAIIANRFPGVRAAIWYGDAIPKSESELGIDVIDTVKLSRTDNDTNILSIGARFVSEEAAKEAIIKWLETPFSGEERHKRRIAQIDSIE